MTVPALTFFKRSDRFEAPGTGYVRGRICVGDLDETFWSSTSIWSIDQYQRSWSAAAAYYLSKRPPVLLYTDVTARASTAYHAVPHGRDILIFEQMLRGARRLISHPLVANALLREQHQLSCWSASLKEFEALARSG